ncbi:MAG: type II toxin-antitoxin system HicB family antitoxin [Ferruginibacter sp.]
MRYNYKILLAKEDEGEYIVTVPALVGCITQGDAIEEVLGYGARSHRIVHRRITM